MNVSNIKIVIKLLKKIKFTWSKTVHLLKIIFTVIKNIRAYDKSSYSRNDQVIYSWLTLIYF